MKRVVFEQAAPGRVTSVDDRQAGLPGHNDAGQGAHHVRPTGQRAVCHLVVVRRQFYERCVGLNRGVQRWQPGPAQGVIRFATREVSVRGGSPQCLLAGLGPSTAGAKVISGRMWGRRLGATETKTIEGDSEDTVPDAGSSRCDDHPSIDTRATRPSSGRVHSFCMT